MEDVVHSHAMAFHCLRWEWRLQKAATVRESFQIENLDDLHRIYPDLDRCFDQQLKSQFFRPAGRPSAGQDKSCRKKVGLDASVETDVVMADVVMSDLTLADPLEQSQLEQSRLEQAAFKSSRRADLIHQLMAQQSGKVKRRSKKVSKSGKIKNDRAQPQAGGEVASTDKPNVNETRNSSTNHHAQSSIQGALDPSMERYKASVEYWYDAISGHDDPLDGLLLEAFERAQQEIGVDVLKWLLKVESSHSVQAHRNEQRLYKIRRQQRFANDLSWAELFEELRHYTFAVSSESPLPQKPPVQTSL
jgi:hypothetical protein